jgi:hypothetical protein
MSDAYERYLADFGERLEAAASPPPRFRRRWVLAAAAAAAVAIAATILLAAPSGDHKINVVAEARAALPGSGELLHLKTVSTTSLVGADEAAQQRFDEFARRHHDEYAPRYFEQWSAGDRWRVAGPTNKVFPKMFAGEPYYPGFYISDEELQRIGLTDELIGPTQEAYADGIDSLYVESLGVIIRSDLKQAGWQTGIGSLPGGIYTGSPTLLGPDPVAAIRKQLDRGDLRDAGTADVDGRSVRRLVSKEGAPFEYDVDAETFEPVRVRMFGHWVGEPDSPYPPEEMVEDVDFQVFETLPLNSETEQLLTIDAPPATTVIDAQGPDEQPPRQDR